MRIYVSGPITGLKEEEYREHFAKAKAFIENMGCEAVIPTENGLPADADYKDHISADIANLVKCDAVLMLYDWYHSRGARMEQFVAHELGIPTFYSFNSLTYRVRAARKNNEQLRINN